VDSPNYQFQFLNGDAMAGPGALALVVFVTGSSLVLLIAVLFSGRNRRMEDRIQNLSDKGKGIIAQPASMSKLTQSVLPKIGRRLLPNNEEERSRLQSRLIHAGLYHRSAMLVFLGIKMILLVVPLILGLVIAKIDGFPLINSLLVGLTAGCLGMLLPSFWLDMRKNKRQIILRRGLPDALDMIVICLRGGLSLQGAFQRVTTELWMAHPFLAAEFSINMREIQLGRTTGDAMRHFAERCDLEEIRSLAGVISQAERLGASTVNALRVHAETLRIKRLQQAEELAHKAGTKMVFPTILCIFPAILLVVIGPAAFQIADLFASMK
jgi:tight adherence protein C